MKVLHVLYSGMGGHGSVFFSMVDADKEKMLQYEAVFFGIEEVREGYIEKANVGNIPWHFVKKKPGLDFSSYRRIGTIIKQSKPDIIFIHTSSYIFPAIMAAWSASKKTKIVVRETQPNHLKTKQEWVGLSFSLLAASKVVFLSTEYSDAIKKRLSLFFSNKRTAVIPNGIDLDTYKPDRKKENEIIKIGMQSRLSGTKDHATLLKAFALCLKKMPKENKVHLLIAGDGECKPALEVLAKELGIEDKIVFTGMLEEKDLPEFINSLDIYVHATLGETMSTAIMQVMACRLPIVASDVLGVNNMIKHNINGFLVPASDEQKLAEAVLFLLDNPGAATKLADAAFEFAVNNYSNKLMLKRYKVVFAE
ncbi:MAG: glycosyltransferase family 4 protein [Ferruginibacter sp.]